MSKQVHKFPLPTPGARNSFQIALSRFVHVGYQNGQPMVWVEVIDRPRKRVIVDIHCFGTGWDIPDSFEYIGTLIDPAGFVWHYYRGASANG